MPKLGDIKLDVVYSEERDKKVKTSDKPIENGLSIVDHVERDPVGLKLTGVCTGTDATTRLSKLESYMDQGKRLTYVGRYSLKDALIESISTSKDVDVAGTAYKFDIELKQSRIVTAAKYSTSKPPSKPPSSGGKKQPTPAGPKKRTYYVVKGGDVLSRIAQKFYGHGTEKYWRIIYNANKAVIGPNPHLIKPGQNLIIP